MKKKTVFILIIAILLIVIGVTFTTIYFMNKAKYDYKIEKVTEINYNVVNENNKYGVIDRQGNVIVEPKYSIIQIPNPSKPVFICMSDYNTETKEYTIKVLNDNGEQLYIGYSGIQAIPTETTSDGVPFEKTALKYKQNGKYGLLNIDGKEVTKPIYDDISSLPYKEGMLLVTQGEKKGVINLNGIEVIDVNYETITTDNYYDVNTQYQKAGFIVSQKTDEGYRYGYINYQGKLVIAPIYTEIERVTEISGDNDIYLVALKDGQAGLLKNQKVVLEYEYEDISYNLYNDAFVVQRNGKQGVTNRKGEIIVPTEYDNILFGGIYINATKDGNLTILDMNGNKIDNTEYVTKMPTQDKQHYIVSNQDEIYKIIDLNGNIVVDKTYTYIEELNNNYYIVANNKKNGIIDLTGKSVVDLKYDNIFKLDNTSLLQANISKNNTVTLINENMKELVTMEKASVEVKDNYVKVFSGDETKYFDYSGNELTAQEVFPDNKLYAKKINKKWGFVDKNGELKVQNEYDMVTEFNEYGFAGIKKDSKWGVINQDGIIIQEPIYEIDWSTPKFIGKYYQEQEWYGDVYYTNEVKEEEE